MTAHKFTHCPLLKMKSTSRLLIGLLVLAASSVEAFHSKRSIAGGDAIDVVEFARASVVGRKREDDGDAAAPLAADAPDDECPSPISSRRRNEEEGGDDLEDSDVGGGREFPSGHHLPPLFYGHH